MATPVNSLPSTSAAVNIQIIEPKNFPGGATPGVVSAPQQQAQLPTQTGNPQQDIQNAYQNAVNARSQAEQALNNYLQFANQLNTQAYQQQPQQQPYGYPYGYPTAGYPQQGAPIYNNQPINQFQPYPYQPQQQQPPVDPYQQWVQQQQQLQQQPPVDPTQQQQPPVDPAAQQQQQPPVDQAQQQQQPPQPQGLENVPVEQLNMMIAQPQTLQEKVDAMEELAVRGQGSPETYQLLQQEAATNTAGLDPQQQDQANYVRQAALWTLGMLNRSQNANAPAAQLPGVSAIEQIIKNKSENPDVKAAAVQALQVMNRSSDPAIQKILKQAAKDKNPDIKALAQQALAGGGPGGVPAFSGQPQVGTPQFAGIFSKNQLPKLNAVA